MSVLLKYI